MFARTAHNDAVLLHKVSKGPFDRWKVKSRLLLRFWGVFFQASPRRDLVHAQLCFDVWLLELAGSAHQALVSDPGHAGELVVRNSERPAREGLQIKGEEQLLAQGRVLRITDLRLPIVQVPVQVDTAA